MCVLHLFLGLVHNHNGLKYAVCKRSPASKYIYFFRLIINGTVSKSFYTNLIFDTVPWLPMPSLRRRFSRRTKNFGHCCHTSFGTYKLARQKFGVRYVKKFLLKRVRQSPDLYFFEFRTKTELIRERGPLYFAVLPSWHTTLTFTKYFRYELWGKKGYFDSLSSLQKRYAADYLILRSILQQVYISPLGLGIIWACNKTRNGIWPKCELENRV